MRIWPFDEIAMNFHFVALARARNNKIIITITIIMAQARERRGIKTKELLEFWLSAVNANDHAVCIVVVYSQVYYSACGRDQDQRETLLAVRAL